MYKNTTEKLIKEAQRVQIIALKQQVRQLLTTVGHLQQENVILRQAIDSSSLMGKKSRTKSRTRSKSTPTLKRNC